MPRKMTAEERAEILRPLEARLKLKMSPQNAARYLRHYQNGSQLHRFLRDPVIQRTALALQARFPGLRKAVSAKEHDSAAAVLIKALHLINDESRFDENIRLLGLPKDTTPEGMLAAIAKAAPELGRSRHEVDQLLTSAEQAGLTDRLWFKGFTESVTREGGNEDPLSDRDRTKLQGDAALRNTIAALYDRAAKEATRRDPRQDLYQAPGALHSAVERAYSALEGKQSWIDPASPGGRAVVKRQREHPLEENNDSVCYERIRSDVETEEREAQEYEDRLQPSALEAEVAAQYDRLGGGEEEENGNG